MPKSHTVRQGECISSIALSYGMLPQSLWEADENEALREQRTHPNALAPGDVVTIPDPENQIFELATGAAHKFLRKGIPEEFTLVLEDEDGKPRKDLPYVVELAGSDTPIEGTTDGSGMLKFPLHPHVRSATLTLKVGEKHDIDEVHELRFGGVDPVETLRGVQHRLRNLGYYCEETGVDDFLTEDALLAFQSDHKLDVTGEIDDKTRDALRKRYGC
jgi:hypothetical protein